MPILASADRKLLDDACVKGRRASEQAVRAALSSLAITAERPPAHLNEDDRRLRRGLRAKARQLGDTGDQLDLLVRECAYEQWHRLLFARFLAENNLLIHPEYRAPVTLQDCEELAESLDEPDGWAVAGRFAAQILPGIFRLDDPCVQLRLAPEGRLALEGIVADLHNEIFSADDALGWVYQYWQREEKDEVNRSERKIAGADIGPVTQLFTENYMVRFLLQNSLGAWWTTRHPESALIERWNFLRFDESGRPASGTFDDWPTAAAKITVMDPFCGSGHFLVEAFEMLWRMRVEEEDLQPAAAQEAVLRDNLFGLELDARCVQIAMFAVALAAWRAEAGWRELPVPNIACSGIPVRARIDDWKELGRGDIRIEKALERLHAQFRHADSLGSLIDPARTTEASDPRVRQGSLDDVDWHEVSELIERAVADEEADPAVAVLGADAVGLGRAADLLTRRYTLVSTNVPYLARSSQSEVLKRDADAYFYLGATDLATVSLLRCLDLCTDGGVVALVLPQHWLYLSSYEPLRRDLLKTRSWLEVMRLGPGAFEAISGEVVNVCLFVAGAEPPGSGHRIQGLDLNSVAGLRSKIDALARTALASVEQSALDANPQARMSFSDHRGRQYLRDFATGRQGIKTGDDGRYRRSFWEVPPGQPGWTNFQTTVAATTPFGGRTDIVYWESGSGSMAKSDGSRIVGREAWGRSGVMVSQMGTLPVSLYSGDLFDTNASPLVPGSPADLPAVWYFCSSPDYARLVRDIDSSLKVTNRTLADVPFDIEHWRAVADEAGPLPESWSDDPTQWLFLGRPETSTSPLLVGVCRLLGYQWPDQPESDDLDALADEDGIVCLPSVRGERSAAERLHELLARSFGGTWTPARTQELLADSGSKKRDLDEWLREDFFKTHGQLFKNRPFIWHVWDGRKDGFSALLNYHQLDRPTLEKLTYSYLGDWIERQVAGVRDDTAGAEERLAAARALQRTLELIVEGEPPYDIYVRWKPLAEQPTGWEPDLSDGVRLNVRPFVEAGVLRARFNVKWDKDRGKNADGSERRNDLHYTLAQKQAARGGRA